MSATAIALPPVEIPAYSSGPDAWAGWTGEQKLADRWWRLSHLYYIVTKGGKKVLFKPNGAQRKLYTDLHSLNIILKSRQHGISTFIALLWLDACLFAPNISALIIAHTEKFGHKLLKDKIRYAYHHLDAKLKRHRSLLSDQAGLLRFSNGSTLEVSLSGRGGTYQYVHVSEYAYICRKFPERAEEVRTGCMEAVKASTDEENTMVVIESTAMGRMGDFFERVKKARALRRKVLRGQAPLWTAMDWRFHFIPWFADPGNATDPTDVFIPNHIREALAEVVLGYKTDVEYPEYSDVVLSESQIAWYAQKYENYVEEGDDEDGQNLLWREQPNTPDEPFAAALKGAYYTKKIIALEREGRITRVPWDPIAVVNTAWDLGIGDPCAIWCWQIVGREVRILRYIEKADWPLEEAFKWMDEELPYRWGKHYGPHDMGHREKSTGKTLEQFAHKFDKNFVVMEQPKQGSFAIDWIQTTRSVLPLCWFDEDKCEDGIEALRHFRKEYDEKRATYQNKYYHDWASHAAASFGVLSQVLRFPKRGPAGSRPRQPRRGSAMAA